MNFYFSLSSWTVRKPLDTGDFIAAKPFGGKINQTNVDCLADSG